MDTSFDLDAYFGRIHWGGEVREDLQTLSGLLGAHMSRIPFEGLDVLLGRPIRLDIEGVQRKLVRDSRGGYCFEHATLFAAALEALGFHPVRHTARVVLFVPRTAAPRTHMFLTVPVREGVFVVDPGFGALAPRVPVPLIDGERVRAADNVHWMSREGQYWVLRTQVRDKVLDGWASSIDEDNLVDFELGNYFTSTHPSSPFKNHLMLRALTPRGRVSVMNRDVTVWDGPDSRQFQLADRQALRSLLAEHFGFDLASVEQLAVPSIPEWK